MEIGLVGLNHRTAPVEMRERVSFTAEQSRKAAEELRARGILEETLVLSTCNRSEIYGVPPESSHECAPGLSSFLSEFHSVQPDVLGLSLYHHYDHDADHEQRDLDPALRIFALDGARDPIHRRLKRLCSERITQ